MTFFWPSAERSAAIKHMPVRRPVRVHRIRDEPEARERFIAPPEPIVVKAAPAPVVEPPLPAPVAPASKLPKRATPKLSALELYGTPPNEEELRIARMVTGVLA